MSIDYSLVIEVINGDWGVEAFCLGTVCWMYIVHEWLSRPHRRMPARWTLGMRVAFCISLLAAGDWITRFVLYFERHFLHADPAPHLGEASSSVLILGGVIGTAGFLLATWEYSRATFGHRPIIISIALLIAMTIFTVATH